MLCNCTVCLGTWSALFFLWVIKDLSFWWPLQGITAAWVRNCTASKRAKIKSSCFMAESLAVPVSLQMAAWVCTYHMESIFRISKNILCNILSTFLSSKYGLNKKTHSLNFYSYPHNIPFKISSLTNLWYHYIHKWYINNNQ